MIETSALYKELRADEGSWYETRVVRGNVTYGDNVMTPYEKPIHSLSINPALFDDDGPQIGIARASVCRLEVTEAKANWPRMASFTVETRIVSEDGTQASEWLPLGLFYTDRRKPDVFGRLSITAYDSMLLLEQSWTDKVETLPSVWPITGKAAAALLEEATGVELENGSILDDSVAFVGLDTEATARAVWSDIAAAHGCNIQMTGRGKLRLVPFAELSNGATAIADLAIAGLAVVNMAGGSSTTSDSFALGLAVTALDTGDDLPAITGVELTTEQGTKAVAGTDGGYTIKGICNFSNSNAAQLCLNRMQGLIYRPFDAQTARLDPAAEPGDLVLLDDVLYQIMAISWTFCAKPTADISAGFEEEVDHEYAVQSAGGRALRIAVGRANEVAADLNRNYLTAVETRSAIQQTATSISQSVAATYVSNDALVDALNEYSPAAQIAELYYNKAQIDDQVDALASEIELTDSSLTVAFSQLQASADDALNAMTYYIRYENGVVIIGKTDSPTSIRISNTQIALYYGNTAISYWNQNKQYTPTELEIPTGGKFTLGSILFQPRSSGNMSCMWVGS